jgi:phosphohistidine swiveling domain-containing protein
MKEIKMQWKKAVERKCSLLFLDFLVKGMVDEYALKVLGEKWGYNYYFYIDKEVFFHEPEFHAVSEKLKEKIKKQGYKFLLDLALKWEKLGNNLIKFAAALNKDLKSKSDKELLKLFREYKEKNYLLSTAVEIPLNIEKIIEAKIREILNSKLKDKEKIDHYFLVLTSAVKPNENTGELKSIILIGFEIQKQRLSLDELNDNIYKLIDKHIEKFGWINTARFYGNPYTRNDIIKRLKTILKTNCKKRLNELEQIEKNNKKETEKIIKELKFNEQEKLIIRIAKEYVFLRTFRMNAYIKSGFIARPFLTELAKRINLDFFDLVYLTSQEIENFFGKNKVIPKKIIEERKKAFGFLLSKGEEITFSGKDLEKYRKKYFPEAEEKEIQSFEGTMASKGDVRGAVKIIKSVMDLAKVNKGDILVAPMTTPDMVPAMEKAAAFVTDEGGILCHAAIVSREMGKPCIIGTKIATKVLKDGDIVEVDATNGVVKIIKRK